MSSILSTLLSVWAPALALGLGYFVYRYTADRRQYNLELERIELERMSRGFSSSNSRKQQDRMISDLSDRLDVAVDLFRRSTAEIKDEVTDALRGVTTEQVYNIQNSSPVVLSEVSSENAAFEVVGELAHALKTPLAQIKSSTTVLKGRLQDFPEHQQALEDMRTSIDICTANLSAYRELMRLSSESTSWSTQDLSHAIEQIFKVYASHIQKSMSVYVSAPSTVSGYSNGYILAMLSPLIENAVEEAPDSTGISVAIEEKTSVDHLVLMVTNKLAGAFDAEAFENRGSTTKGNSHGGLGTSITKRLVSSQPGASLDYEVLEDRLAIRIELPGRTDA